MSDSSQLTRSCVSCASRRMRLHKSGSREGFSVWTDHVIMSPPLATYTLHALASEASNPLLPFSDKFANLRPAFLSNSRSVSMSLQRYHHVEMPMPSPNPPIVEFSCQKQPTSLSTALVNRPAPATALTSSSDTKLHGPLWNPRRLAAWGGGVGFAVAHPESAAAKAVTAIISRVRLVITRPMSVSSTAGSGRAHTDRQSTDRGSAPTTSQLRGWCPRWPSTRCP